ncbi:LuxR C-terminal-related transcriptional regulator [Streptomyces rochei]|uniref:LuxR C-terminal-related transcriptional regulator n=1 Tax=Streptomyces rochei TaxID=1928 RepID=UPI0034669B32
MIRVYILGEPEDREALAGVLRTLPDLTPLLPGRTEEGARRVPPGTDLLLLNAPRCSSSVPETLRRLRTAPDAPPAAVVTATEQDAYVADCLTAGAAGILHHDLSPALLLSAIRILVAGGSVLFQDPRAAVLPVPGAAAPAAAVSAEAAVKRLTARQREILRLLAIGLTNAEISRRLGISGDTVKEHVRAVLRELGVPRRISAALLVYRTGLLDRLSSDAT